MNNDYEITKGNVADFNQLDHFQRKSVSFIREVQITHGTEKASAIVNAFSDVLGREWSNQLILDMVCGNTSRRPNTTSISALNYSDLIGLIRALRSVTNFGLADSKNAIVKLKEETHTWQSETKETRIENAPTLDFTIVLLANVCETIEQAHKILRDAGFHVHE